MLQRVIDAAEAAGRAIQEIRSAGFGVERKGSQGPVTEADRAADALLKRELLALEDCGWLSEETTDDRVRLDHERVWVVDPLDGTKEFVGGIAEYAVAVALVEGGRPVLGVVHNPATGETYAAQRGGGAFKDGHRLRVVESDKLLASRSEIKRGEFAGFERDWNVVAVGSIEYKLALVGSGAAAVTFSRGPKWEWDVCAGALIVEEAGGTTTDLFGASLEFNKSFPKVKGILSGAPTAFGRARQAIEVIGASDRMNEFGDVDIEAKG